MSGRFRGEEAMKINQVTDVTGLYRANAKKVRRPDGAAPPQGRDEVTMSPQAQEVLALKAKLAELPEVREDVVQRIKQQIESGSYRVPARAVAEALLKDFVGGENP